MAFKAKKIILPADDFAGETVKYKVTEAAFKANPELEAAGIQIGDEIDIVKEEKTEEDKRSLTPSDAEVNTQLQGNEKKQAPQIENGDKKSRARAKEIADKLGVDLVLQNDKGEYFTSRNAALLSVKGDHKKLKKHNF